MPKIDVANIPSQASTNYPPQYHKVVEGRSRKRLGNAIGLTQFGVNICTLKPGAASSLRHWHSGEDELVYVLEGEVVLVENEGETVLKAGDAAGWKANSGNGHCLINRSNADARFIEIGTRATHDHVEYPEADLVIDKNEKGVRRMRKSGEPYA
jgi:uncharacterized cupin superfamily protein